MTRPPSSPPRPTRHASLKMLAEYVGLSSSTISFVLNNSPGRSIPEATRARIKEAAAKFNYQPSMIARTLQGKRMQTVGILLPELGEGYHSQVLSGVGDLLMQKNYFYFTVHHRHRKDLIAAYPDLLRSRGVDGILAIDTHLDAPRQCQRCWLRVIMRSLTCQTLSSIMTWPQGWRSAICDSLVIAKSLSCTGSLSVRTPIHAGLPYLRRPASSASRCMRS
jgi:hypothetical protein